MTNNNTVTINSESAQALSVALSALSDTKDAALRIVTAQHPKSLEIRVAKLIALCGKEQIEVALAAKAPDGAENLDCYVKVAEFQTVLSALLQLSGEVSLTQKETELALGVAGKASLSAKLCENTVKPIAPDKASAVCAVKYDAEAFAAAALKAASSTLPGADDQTGTVTFLLDEAGKATVVATTGTRIAKAFLTASQAQYAADNKAATFALKSSCVRAITSLIKGVKEVALQVTKDYILVVAGQVRYSCARATHDIVKMIPAIDKMEQVEALAMVCVDNAELQQAFSVVNAVVGADAPLLVRSNGDGVVKVGNAANQVAIKAKESQGEFAIWLSGKQVSSLLKWEGKGNVVITFTGDTAPLFVRKGDFSNTADEWSALLPVKAEVAADYYKKGGKEEAKADSKPSKKGAKAAPKKEAEAEESADAESASASEEPAKEQSAPAADETELDAELPEEEEELPEE